MNGTTQERDLLTALDVLGWEGVRAPASGTAPREQPDVLAAKRGVVLNGELKSGGPPRNPEQREVQDLFTFGTAFAAGTTVIARFKGDRAFYFARPGDMKRTPSGHFSIPSDPARFPFEAVVEYSPADGPDDQSDARAMVLTDGVDDLVAWVQDVARQQASAPLPDGIDIGDGDG
jgi:Holliday junction resolvase